MPDTPVPPYRNNPNAPLVYFDLVAAHGVMNGAVQIELAGRNLLPQVGSDAVDIELMTTARLRCSPAAAALLRDSLDVALKMIAGPADEAQKAAAQKLN